jgi:hypothetical protein
MLPDHAVQVRREVLDVAQVDGGKREQNLLLVGKGLAVRPPPLSINTGEYI